MTPTLYFLRAIVVIVFATAALSKARDVDAFLEFEDAVRKLARVRGRAVRLVALLVVLAELLVVAGMAWTRTSLPAFILAAGLLSAFLVALARAVRDGVVTECQCFGSNGSSLSWSHVIRNALLASFAGIGAVLAAWVAAPPWPPSAPLVTPGVLGVMCAALIVRWDDVAYLAHGAS